MGCEEYMENELDLDSGCRQIKGTLILNIRRYKKHCGLRTHTTAMGGSRDGRNSTRCSAIEQFHTE